MEFTFSTTPNTFSKFVGKRIFPRALSNSPKVRIDRFQYGGVTHNQCPRGTRVSKITSGVHAPIDFQNTRNPVISQRRTMERLDLQSSCIVFKVNNYYIIKHAGSGVQATTLLSIDRSTERVREKMKTKRVTRDVREEGGHLAATSDIWLMSQQIACHQHLELRGHSQLSARPLHLTFG
ncbi:hypothetical protein J6590_077691 [Homalodisca vitripennis]|nr:hypothetical protein J6590_077691 [Homalodisca vitripennis]